MTDRACAGCPGNNFERMVTLDYDGRVHRLTSAGVHDVLLGDDTTDTLDLLTDYSVPVLGASRRDRAPEPIRR